MTFIGLMFKRSNYWIFPIAYVLKTIQRFGQ